MVNVAILGSTGSIGTQTLEVCEHLPGYRIYGISGHSNLKMLGQQIAAHQPEVVVVPHAEAGNSLEITDGIEILYGNAGLCQLASDPKVDIVVMAIVGFAGLEPTLAALRAGKRVALANKETLVVGGSLVMEYASQIIPIDSEHSAIWQILDGKNKNDIASLILTASGGPFRDENIDLDHVTVEQALQHPTWDMGGKITIDSATLMNKGLEVIEAHHLFNISYENIEVVVHPQSVVHSLVRFKDGSVLAQMATTDMRLPIQYALTYPKMASSQVAPLDLYALPTLSFSRHDSVRFPCLELAYTAGKVGGTMPTVLNAGNEVAVNLFLGKKIRFTDIAAIVKQTMNQHQSIEEPTLEDLLAVDQETRKIAASLSESIGRKG